MTLALPGHQLGDLRARCVAAEADVARLTQELTAMQASTRELRRAAREAQVAYGVRQDRLKVKLHVEK